MSKFKNTFRIETSRLKDWDYSSPWWYYITINTKDHIEYFGTVENEKMILNELGKIADEEWKKTKSMRKNVDLDYYVIMPNHIHGIIIINGPEVETHRVRLRKKNVETDSCQQNRANACISEEENWGDAFDASLLNEIVMVPNCRDVARNVSTDNNRFSEISPRPNSLSVIVRAFKSAVTKQIHEKGYTNFSWQSRFYDRIIRDDKELLCIRKYILDNPMKWYFERNNPENIFDFN